MARLVLHIGTHKTGTTSFQRWARDNAAHLADAASMVLYDGVFPDARELGAVAVDPDRETPGIHRRRQRGEAPDAPMPLRGTAQWDRFSDEVAARIASQARDPERFVISSESLSLLRRPAELRRLRALLPAGEVAVVVCLRDPADFLRSWTRHLRRDFFALSDDPTSFAYVGPDSWLVDYGQLLGVWRSEFGDDAVTAVDYDAAVATFGSTIPALMDAIAPGVGELPTWDGYRLNTAGEGPRRPVRGLSGFGDRLNWSLWRGRRAARRASGLLSRAARRLSRRP